MWDEAPWEIGGLAYGPLPDYPRMKKYQIIFEYVVPSRTPSRRTKTIEAKDITEASRAADNDAEVAWGFQKVVSVEEICPTCGGKNLKAEEGSIQMSGLVRHGGGTAYLQCQQCGTLLNSNTHELVRV